MTRETHTLEDVIGRYLAGRASDDESAWLSARLGESSDDLDLMVDALLVEAGLIELGEDGGLGALPGRVGRWWQRPGWVSLGSAAAIVAIAAWVMAQFIAPVPPPFAKWEVSPGGLVAVTGASESNGDLQPGSTLRVNQGCVEVTLASGVRCLVQAPGTLHLDDDRRMRFEDGTARFTLEPGSKGIEVLTHDLRVIDLGTDFGIDARHPHRTEVHVIDGMVEATTRSGRRESMQLEAGRAVALGPVGTLETTLFKPDRFLDALPTGIPALRFHFDKSSANDFASGLIARRDGVQTALSTPDAAGVVAAEDGHALSMHGNGHLATSWPGIGGTSPRTIAFRIRMDAEANPHASAILGWGNFHDPKTMSDFGIRTSGPSGKIRVVSGRRWLQSEASITDGQWHHVAIVLGEHRTGSWPKTRLYLNGQEETFLPGEPWEHTMAPLDTFHTEIHHPLSQPLTIGRIFIDSQAQFIYPLHGEIQDIIIAEGTLNTEQIQALHEGRLYDSGLDVF